MAKYKHEDEQKPLNNPNDKFFKKLFGLIGVVQDYLNSQFPKQLSEKLNLNTLELDTTTYLTDELKEYYSDIVWRCQLLEKKATVNICFIFEHKSYVPDYPHIQIGDYKQGAYNKQLAAGQPLSIVVPSVVYHGKRQWIIKPFSSYFGDVDEDFLRFVDPYDFYLTNLQDYPDETIEAFTNIFLMKGFLALKHHTDKKYIRSHFVVLAFAGFEKNNSKEEFDFAKYFYVYLSNIVGGITKKEIDVQIEQIEDNIKKQAMYNYIEDILEKGIEKGKKIAIYEAYQRGGDLDLLSRLFDLPTKKIIQIIEEVKNMEQLKRKK